MKHLYGIVLNYNGFENTILCLKSLVKSRIPQGFEFTFAVVDNASLYFPSDVLAKEFPQVKIIQNEKNLGYSGGNNVGISFALKNGATHILVINNDTVVLRDSLYELIVGMREKDFDVVCPKIYFEKGFEYHKDWYSEENLGKVLWFAGGEMDWNNIIGYHRGVDEVDHGQYDKKFEMDFLTGACFLSKAEVYNRVGFFDEKFFLYYEDADLSMRIKRKNFKIGFIPKAIVYHKNAGSTGGSGSDLQDYFITRNRLLFGKKYAHMRAKIALLREAVWIAVQGRKWQKKGVFDFFVNKFGKGSYPI